MFVYINQHLLGEEITVLPIRHYTPTFGRKIASLFEKLKPECPFIGDDPTNDGRAIWEAWEWGDRWEDAAMPSFIKYLYGARSLRVPPQWKPLLPKTI